MGWRDGSPGWVHEHSLCASPRWPPLQDPRPSPLGQGTVPLPAAVAPAQRARDGGGTLALDLSPRRAAPASTRPESALSGGPQVREGPKILAALGGHPKELDHDHCWRGSRGGATPGVRATLGYKGLRAGGALWPVWGRWRGNRSKVAERFIVRVTVCSASIHRPSPTSPAPSSPDLPPSLIPSTLPREILRASAPDPHYRLLHPHCSPCSGHCLRPSDPVPQTLRPSDP